MLLNAKGNAPDEPLLRADAVAVGPEGVPFVTGYHSHNAFRVAFSCPPLPLAGCRTPVEPRAQLVIKEPGRFTWKWIRGQATAVGDFGDPTVDTEYSLCAYDESNGGTLVSS